MTALKSEEDVSTPRANARRYWIGLKIAPADREDAWELCRVAVHYGGVEVDDCCFAFPNEERWLSALDALRLRFGTEYFETVESTEVDPDCREIAMASCRHLELLSRGPVSVVRLRNPEYFTDDEVAELTREWNSVADRARLPHARHGLFEHPTCEQFNVEQAHRASAATEAEGRHTDPSRPAIRSPSNPDVDQTRPSY